MSEPTTSDPATETASQTHPVTESATDSAPGQPAGAGDDGGAALDRVEEAISEARDAGTSVAANDDIITRDDEKAGEYSETPEGQGGAPLT